MHLCNCQDTNCTLLARKFQGQDKNRRALTHRKQAKCLGFSRPPPPLRGSCYLSLTNVSEFGYGNHCIKLVLLLYVLSHFSCVQFFVTLWTVAHQTLLSMGILQERILEWAAMASSRRSSQPRDQTHVS